MCENMKKIRYMVTIGAACLMAFFKKSMILRIHRYGTTTGNRR